MEYTSMPNPTAQYPRTGVVRKLLNDNMNTNREAIVFMSMQQSGMRMFA